jgi:hypothetical protein
LTFLSGQICSLSSSKSPRPAARLSSVRTPEQLRGALCRDATADLIDATHIFDGLTVFPTHIAHLQLGATPDDLVMWDTKRPTEDLFNLALNWIRVDRDLRREQEKARGRERGPKNDVSLLYTR